MSLDPMKPKVLIVEDDEVTRALLVRRLGASGFETSTASDGVAAVQMAQTGKPDIILLDLGLPGGDGFSVLQRLRLMTRLQAIPVVVLSSGDPLLIEERVLKAGAVAYFQKPPDLERLVEALHGHLSGPRAGEAASKRKVLVVEDDADLRRLLSAKLRASGYEVALAADAVSVLTVARKERPDLMLLDLGLPGGEGKTVLARLRAQAELGSVPVIVLSSRDAAAAGPEVLSLGAAAYLQKPVDMDRLLSEIGKALAAP